MTEAHLRYCYDDGYYWALKCLCSCADGIRVVRVRYVAFRLTFHCIDTFFEHGNVSDVIVYEPIVRPQCVQLDILNVNLFVVRLFDLNE